MSVLLGAALVAMPIQSRSQLLPAICIVIVVGTGTAAVIWIMSCGPKYYCVYDPEVDQQWCRAMSKADRQLDNLKVVSGPYKDASRCNIPCSKMPTNSFSPPIMIHIQKSTNLVNWIECASFEADPECFEWSDKISASSCYYRVWY